MNQEIYTGPYLKNNPQHLYIAPADSCKDIVAHYTLLHPGEEIIATKEYRILPDASGCIIFQGEERLDYWGPMQELVVLENDANEAKRRFFIEFHPGGLYAISGIPLSPFKNKREAFHHFSQELANILSSFYHQSNTYDDLVSFLNDWIYEQKQKHPIPDTLLMAKTLIEEHNGVLSMEKLSEQLHRSLRQLRRDFAKYIGLSPKEYANVVRINHIVKELSQDALIATALAGGYFDQAHFNKMFKQVLQVSPTRYFENIREFYQEIYKF